MAALKAEQLESHLARELRPLYTIHGDEPLLALEAGDAIRARARTSGFSERVVLAADRGFKWGELAASGASLSLFGDKKLIELRLPSGKPGADGAEAIEDFCEKLSPDILALVSLPRLDRAGQNSAWFKALEANITKHYKAVTLPTMSTGATDMAFLRRKGMQCYGIGPATDSEDGPKGFGAHSDQERILESELYRFVRFNWDAVVDLARAK